MAKTVEPKASSLTKADLADAVYKVLGGSRKEAKEFVVIFFDEISRALESNEGVKLKGFGSFRLREKSERPGRNPKTGESVLISARRVVTFSAARDLRAAVKKGGVSAGE